jgi:hypothetical protein
MPKDFTTQRSILRNVVVGGSIQATLAEALADADLTYRARPETSGFFQIELEKESDYQYAGKGHSFATESRLIAQSSSGEINTRLDDYLAGYFLAMVMGNELFTAAVAPATANTHVLTWKDTGAPAQVTNVYVEDAPGLKRKFEDMSCTKVVLSGTNKGSVLAKASFIGTGRYADGPVANLPALPTAQYLYGSDSIVSLGPAGAPVSMSPRILSWELTFDHANDLFRSCGGGVYAVFPRYGNPICSAKIVVAVDTSSDIRDWMMNQTLLEMKVAISSGAASLTIDYPNIIIPKADLGEQDKYVIHTIELNQESILKPTGSEVCTATVMNTAAAYLTSAAL